MKIEDKIADALNKKMTLEQFRDVYYPLPDQFDESGKEFSKMNKSDLNKEASRIANAYIKIYPNTWVEKLKKNSDYQLIMKLSKSKK